MSSSSQFSRLPSKAETLLAVDLAAVPHLDNQNQHFLVPNSIDDAVVAHPNAPERFFTR